MSNIHTYSISALNTPTATYPDSFVSYIQNPIKYESGFLLNEIKALEKIADSSINNGTIQYLTDQKLQSSFITYRAYKSVRKTLTTPLIFNSIYDFNDNLFVYVNYTTEIQGTGESLNYTLSNIDTTNFINNIMFELEFLDNKFLRVKHCSGKFDYFLNATTSGRLSFIRYESTLQTLTSERSDMFRYLIDDDGYLQLFKAVDTTTKIVTISGGSMVLVPLLSSNINRSGDNLIRISYFFKELTFNPNSSWVSYNKNRLNSVIIDPSRSEYDKRSQYLLHTPYSVIDDSISLNFLNLHNHLSERGFAKRGTNMIKGDPNLPKTYFREYTTLFTGNDQEGGNDNISLSYVFYDKDILIKGGTDTYFTTPSSIYPYDLLNINDTTFVQNGSIGGPSPLISDKIRTKRLKTTSYNNGRYLFTWLSANNPDDYGVWVDRYYYPDILSKYTSLAGIDKYNVSFLDDIDRSNIYNSRDNISKYVFFDKKSDMLIEPNTGFTYTRVGSDDITSIIQSTSPSVSGFNSYYNIKNNIVPFEGSSILLDGQRYAKYSKQTANENKQFTVSFECYIDPRKKYGYQLLGNKTSQGFAVQIDGYVTPFIYYYNLNKMFIYNTDYKIISVTVFDNNIKDIIPGLALDDFIVVCDNGFVYKCNAAGIKNKLEIIPEIATYTNYLQEPDSITFLLPDTTETRGICYKMNKNNFHIELIETVPLSIYKNEPPSVDYALSIIKHKDILYRIPGTIAKKPTADSDIIFYTRDNYDLIRYNFRTNKADVFLLSESLITDFTFDYSDNIIVSHGENVTTLSIQRDVISTFTLNNTTLSGSTITGVDVVRYYIEGAESSFVTCILYTPEQEIILMKLEPELDSINSYIYPTGFSRDINLQDTLPRFTQTNFNYLSLNNSKNNIRFSTTLINYLSTEDSLIKDIAVDITNIDTGYHIFTYRFDSIQGNISLFIDGRLYENVTISPGKYKTQELLADDLYIGTAGFINGIDLATYLDQPGAFYIKNLWINNFFLYDRALNNDEIIALSLFNKKINDIVLSIPAGQRNNIEEIERYFKYSNTNSSKNIDIHIKNLHISSSELKADIEKTIREQSRSLVPAGVNINNITFPNYR